MSAMFITSPYTKPFSFNSKKYLKPVNKKPRIIFKMNLENLKEYDDSELDPETKKVKREKG